LSRRMSGADTIDDPCGHTPARFALSCVSVASSDKMRSPPCNAGPRAEQRLSLRSQAIAYRSANEIEALRFRRRNACKRDARVNPNVLVSQSPCTRRSASANSAALVASTIHDASRRCLAGSSAPRDDFAKRWHASGRGQPIVEMVPTLDLRLYVNHSAKSANDDLRKKHNRLS